MDYRRGRDVPEGVVEHERTLFVVDEPPLDLGHVLPGRRVEAFPAAFCLVERRLDAVYGDGFAAAGDPDFLHKQREAAHVVGMLVCDDEGGGRIQVDAGCQEALNEVAAAVDDQRVPAVGEGEQGGGTVRIGHCGAGAKEVKCGHSSVLNVHDYDVGTIICIPPAPNQAPIISSV